ncbi:MAG: hypothetical protein ACKOS8_03255 [Gemmataceae bacterium]
MNPHLLVDRTVENFLDDLIHPLGHQEKGSRQEVKQFLFVIAVWFQFDGAGVTANAVVVILGFWRLPHGDICKGGSPRLPKRKTQMVHLLEGCNTKAAPDYGMKTGPAWGAHNGPPGKVSII